jgi:LacI family transcriptional regulator
MKNRITVYDIARKLDISPSTVSRVLNNSSLIGEEKRQLILAAAEELGYQKRQIRKQGCRAIINIRLFLPPTKYDYIHLFYDVAELIDGIQQGFGSTKVNIIISINDGDLQLFDSKKIGDIDGCIFAFTMPSPEMETLLEERTIPYILLNRQEPENNYLVVDSLLGMKCLVEAMWRKHADDFRPCYIGFSPLGMVTRLREEGVRNTCALHGKELLAADVFNIDQIKELQGPVLDAILERKYNCVLCFNDLLAVSVYQSALHRGIAIPQAFSLSGFDNSPMLQLLDQRIDTIEFSIHSLGTEAGLWLRAWIIDRDFKPIQKKLEGTYMKGETI